jgi:transcriptional regulator with XRE-family HTH domain
MDLEQFGKKLRAAREMKGLTQEEVVQRLGKKDVTAISEYENGKRRLAAVELPDYALALDVPITFFFGDILAEGELETGILGWFRALPSDRIRRRMFQFVQQVTPSVVNWGEEDVEIATHGHTIRLDTGETEDSYTFRSKKKPAK